MTREPLDIGVSFSLFINHVNAWRKIMIAHTSKIRKILPKFVFLQDVDF